MVLWFSGKFWFLSNAFSQSKSTFCYESIIFFHNLTLVATIINLFALIFRICSCEGKWRKVFNENKDQWTCLLWEQKSWDAEDENINTVAGMETVTLNVTISFVLHHSHHILRICLQMYYIFRSLKSLGWLTAMGWRPSCFYIFFPRTTGPILTKFGKKHL